MESILGQFCLLKHLLSLAQLSTLFQRGWKQSYTSVMLSAVVHSAENHLQRQWIPDQPHRAVSMYRGPKLQVNYNDTFC